MADPLDKNNEEKKLDWMYKDSNQIVDQEEYLLGRKVDKQLENSLLPPGKNEECLPSSIFTGLPVESQVDIARKVQEDPLYLIKKKEIENREQLLKNPRKLKQLQEMIARQQAAAEKLKRKEMKKMKKKKIKDIDSILAKKCIKLFGSVDAKSLAALQSSSDQSSSESESNSKIRKKKKKSSKKLDKLLAVKYKRLIGNIDAKKLAEISSSSDSEKVEIQNKKRSSSSDHKSLCKKAKVSHSKEINSKENHYSNEKKKHNNKSVVRHKERSSNKKESHSKRKTVGKDQKHDEKKLENDHNRFRQSSGSSSNETSDEDTRNTKQGKFSSIAKADKHRENNCKEFEKRREQTKGRGRSSKKAKHRVKRESSSSSNESSSSTLKPAARHNIKSKIGKHQRDVSYNSSFSDSSSNKSNKTRKRYKNKTNKTSRTEESSSSSSSDESLKNSKQKKQYGLVLPTNYVPKEKMKETKPPSVNTPAADKKTEKHEFKKKLTEEEKELKLKEMMNNAKWRDELRDKNIKLHEEKLKAEKDNYVYNKDFMRIQMAHAISQETVESRVKANINTIQRSKASMNEHFARRK